MVRRCINSRNCSLFVMVPFFFLLGACSSRAGEESDCRPSAVAGKFYPGDADDLKAMVQQYLDAAPKKSLTGRIVAAIAPHAGYVYSGGVAAYTYKQLEGLSFDTVVLIGPCHNSYRIGLQGISVYRDRCYTTPLGEVEVNQRLARALIGEGKPFTSLPSAHQFEHCLEVQLPFLQTVMKNFTIVPILVGTGQGNETVLAKALLKHLRNENALVIASTDMTHYPTYTEANTVDRGALEIVKSLDCAALREYDREVLRKGKENLHCTFCGLSAVLTVMEYARGLDVQQVEILKYANSGDVPIGDKRQVVGYGSVVFLASQSQTPLRSADKSAAQETVQVHLLPEKVGQDMLVLARKTLENLTTGQEIPRPIRDTKPYIDKYGVFVTLLKGKELRGCIGHIFPVTSLEQAVIDNAVSAASKDYRFSPVKASEVKDLTIEISVLTPPRQIASVDEFVTGKHGIIIKKGFHQAVFLPQVAPEQGWDRNTTLSHLCRKAGLHPDAWKEGADFYIFEAQIFHEGETRL